MGWFKNGLQHGFAKYMMSDNTTWFEGLFENDIYKFQNIEEIKSYSHKDSFIAQPIMWHFYITN